MVEAEGIGWTVSCSYWEPLSLLFGVGRCGRSRCRWRGARPRRDFEGSSLGL